MTIATLPALRRSDLAWTLTGLSLALAALTLPVLLVDPRSLAGDPVWLKPFKFAVSFVVFFGTIALVLERTSAAVRDGRIVRACLVAMAIALIGEMAYIIQQAALGQDSHYNLSTRYHETMYSLMGLGATVLVLGMGAIGLRAAVDRDGQLGPGLRLAVGLGFAGSALLTLVTAFTLASGSGHFVGTPSDGAATLPLFGWSGEVGDLRPAHFLALHGMQIIPLAGAALDARAPSHARAGVVVATLAWAAVTLAVFAQALQGQPLIRL